MPFWKKEKSTSPEAAPKPPPSQNVRSPKDLPLKAFLGIEYRLVKTERFDDYMREMGINVVMRKIGVKIVPTLLSLSYAGGKYHLVASSLFLHFTVSFKLGEPFVTKTPDGRTCTVVFSYEEPNKLMEVQREKKVVTVLREFTIEKVHMTLTVNNTVCKMTYINMTKLRSADKPTYHANSPQPTVYTATD